MMMMMMCRNNKPASVCVRRQYVAKRVCVHGAHWATVCIYAPVPSVFQQHVCVCVRTFLRVHMFIHMHSREQSALVIAAAGGAARTVSKYARPSHIKPLAVAAHSHTCAPHAQH